MSLYRFTLMFPFWTLGGSVVALLYPGIFTWFSGGFITFGLGMIMLGMGLGLTVDDFGRILEYPWRVFLGVLLQYTIMPLSALGVSMLFSFSPELAAGLILVGTCPGGTASNVITYLARANVALSVTLTSVSTILSVVLTPVISYFLIGSRVNVDVAGLFFGTLQVVIVPVALGLLLNRYFHGFSRKLQPFAPPLAVVMIVMIVSSIIGGSRDNILASGPELFSGVMLFHALGFVAGYFISRSVFSDEATSRTISIEVGMQNSGLGVYLATMNFSSPLTAIPGALSSLVHSLVGSFLASVWRKKA